MSSQPLSDTTGPSAITIPDSIESSSAKLVYLFVNTVQRATLDEIRSALDMKLLTVCGVLKSLVESNHVVRDGEYVSLPNAA